MVPIIVSSFKTKQITSSKNTDINYIPYYLKVYEADSLFLTNNFKGSYKILDSLFQKYEPINMENYKEYGNYIASSVMTGHIKDIDEKIKKGFSNFGTIGFNHPESSKLFDTIRKVTKLSKEDFTLFLKDYSKKINLDLRKRIVQMDIEDQSSRGDNYSVEKMKFYQKKHKKEIEDIISNYGYPNYQIIGSSGYSDPSNPTQMPIIFTTIFLHQDNKILKKHLPMLLENLKKGKCSPDDYASIFDRLMWETRKDSKQLYGTFPDHGNLHPEKIDSIRKSIGLPRFGYETWAFNTAFPNISDKN